MSSKIKKTKSSNNKNQLFYKTLLYFGFILILVSLLILGGTFFPTLKEEVKYSLKRSTNQTVIKPVSDDFAIVIPKINANARVVEDVDPYDAKKYQQALTQGVAHALGSGRPGNAGNTFLFAHSSADWYTANRFNSVFYLLHKLEVGDKIEIYYQKNKFSYKVTEKKLVDPNEVSYLSSFATENTSILTLMTCWPPGTTLKRLIIKSQIANN